MKNSFALPVLLGALVAVLALSAMPQFSNKARAYSTVARPAPEFTQTDPEAWLGSEPLSIKDLRGKVVFIDIWTYGCWNCYRSFPWLNALEEKLADEDFQVIGIHTPEFEHEKVRENIVEKIKEFELKHPSMMDNDFAYWRKLDNRYWPTYYLVDKKGYIRHYFIGETHTGSKRAREIEFAIKQLLMESV